MLAFKFKITEDFKFKTYYTPKFDYNCTFLG